MLSSGNPDKGTGTKPESPKLENNAQCGLSVPASGPTQGSPASHVRLAMRVTAKNSRLPRSPHFGTSRRAA